MNRLFSTLLILVFFISCTAQTNSSIQKLGTTDFKTIISSDEIQLVDVRTPKEFAAGHIQGAINSNYFDKNELISFFKTLDKSKPVAVYCKVGGRSAKAANILEEMGFKEIYDLKGGYLLERLV